MELEMRQEAVQTGLEDFLKEPYLAGGTEEGISLKTHQEVFRVHHVDYPALAGHRRFDRSVLLAAAVVAAV